MMQHRKQRETLTEKLGGKKNVIAMTVFAVIVLAAGIIWTEIEREAAYQAKWIGSYPMANQNIEWTYAGKGGF